MKWLELSVEAHAEAVDAVSNVFHEHGTGGVAIEQAVSSHIEGEELPVYEGLPVIRAYLPMNGNESAIVAAIEQDLWHLQAFNLSPVGPMLRKEVEEEDWANGWKEHFHPLKIGRVVVKPSWREWAASPDDLIVEIDPGMAFGTGLHPTTNLILMALQSRVRPGMHVLDLGTGSGILAIPAALLGATVEALDISDVAAGVAVANVERNHLSDRIRVSCGSLDDVRGKTYDLVLANIIASVLIDLAPDLALALQPGGELLASGIIEPRLEEVTVAFAAAGLIVGEPVFDGDWCLLVGRRPN